MRIQCFSSTEENNASRTRPKPSQPLPPSDMTKIAQNRSTGGKTASQATLATPRIRTKDLVHEKLVAALARRGIHSLPFSGRRKVKP